MAHGCQALKLMEEGGMGQQPIWNMYVMHLYACRGGECEKGRLSWSLQLTFCVVVQLEGAKTAPLGVTLPRGAVTLSATSARGCWLSDTVKLREEAWGLDSCKARASKHSGWQMLRRRKDSATTTKVRRGWH